MVFFEGQLNISENYNDYLMKEVVVWCYAYKLCKYAENGAVQTEENRIFKELFLFQNIHLLIKLYRSNDGFVYVYTRSN